MSICPSFRVLTMVATALLIGTLIASSAAHALGLGDAVAQSALGSPLRVVIPITAARGLSLQPSCFRLIPATGDASVAIVTARVSLERAASAPRLVVTTPNPVNEPAIRFGIQATCDGSTRRGYVLLLDPPGAGTFTAAAATPNMTRASRDRALPQPAAAQRSAAGTTIPETLVVRPPVLAEHESTPRVAASEILRPERASQDVVVSAALRQVAGTPALTAVAGGPPLTRLAAIGGSGVWYLVAVALALAGVIALTVLLARRHRAPLEIPQWTRSPHPSGPRSFADFSAAPVTLPHTLSSAGETTQPGTAAPSRAQTRTAAASALGVEAPMPRSRSRHGEVDPSTIDTLLDAVDPDMVEERAVREAWAAARSDVEREMDGDAILQAIEAAERDLELAPATQAHSAIDRALDDDLLQPQRRH